MAGSKVNGKGMTSRIALEPTPWKRSPYELELIIGYHSSFRGSSGHVSIPDRPDPSRMTMDVHDRKSGFFFFSII